MQDNAKCFIKISKGIYEEITYKDLMQRRKKDSTYKIKRFIPVQQMLIEVTDKEYKKFYKAVERHKYYSKLKRKFQEVSMDKMKDDEDIRDKDTIQDYSINIEQEIENKEEIEQLKEALLKLNNEEYMLIKALFYEEKTIREYAEIIGKAYATVEYRKKQILKKLKKFIKF